MIVDCSIQCIKYATKIVLGTVNFQLNIGDCLLITGASGSGKSTLLHFISGLLDHKQVSIDGNCNILKGTKIVFIAQDPDSNIISNDVKSELLLYSGTDIERILGLLTKYGIPENFLNKNTNELSGGQKQLLAVLCGIIQEVELYVLDEPTAMLDRENTIIVIEIIQELLKNQKTVVISTHDKLHFGFANKYLELYHDKKKHQSNLFLSKSSFLEKHTLQLRNINFYYNKREVIFKDFNLNLQSKDILLISGKNGAGKTTLAKLMGGLIKPRDGEILFNGRKINKISNYLPVIFSYSLQNPNWQLLFESVDKEVKYSLKKFLGQDTDSYNEQLNTLLDNTNINKDNEPRELSFGQKKFISNFSYYHNPIIHFFDEPDIGCDEIFEKYFLDLLFYRKENCLISVIVSHNEERYKCIANKHIILK